MLLKNNENSIEMLKSGKNKLSNKKTLSQDKKLNI